MAALSFVERVKVERVAGGDDELAVFLADRKQRLAVDQLLRKHLEQRQIDFGFGQVDEVDADFFADGLEGQLFGDEAELNGRFDELRAVAVAIGDAAALFELAAVKQAASQEDFAGFHSVGLVLRNERRRKELRRRRVGIGTVLLIAALGLRRPREAIIIYSAPSGRPRTFDDAHSRLSV